jgi:hypothetical protein
VLFPKDYIELQNLFRERYEESTFTDVMLGVILSTFRNVNNLYFYSSHPTNTVQSIFPETPPFVLKERIRHYQKEYDELRDFTVLEKQIYNADSYKEVCTSTVLGVCVCVCEWSGH